MDKYTIFSILILHYLKNLNFYMKNLHYLMNHIFVFFDLVS